MESTVHDAFAAGLKLRERDAVAGVVQHCRQEVQLGPAALLSALHLLLHLFAALVCRSLLSSAELSAAHSQLKTNSGSVFRSAPA